MSDHCGSITEEGNAVCVPGACICSSEEQKSETVLLPPPSPVENKNAIKVSVIGSSKIASQEKTIWQKIRSGTMFVIACVTSPCCTPIIVPIGLALLAGTPFALWASVNIGWVYGGLTLLSVVSLVLGFRWMGGRTESNRSIKTAHKAAASGDL